MTAYLWFSNQLQKFSSTLAKPFSVFLSFVLFIAFSFILLFPLLLLHAISYWINSVIFISFSSFFIGQPRPLFRLFLSFSTNNTIFITNQCKKCHVHPVYGAGIRTHNIGSKFGQILPSNLKNWPFNLKKFQHGKISPNLDTLHWCYLLDTAFHGCVLVFVLLSLSLSLFHYVCHQFSFSVIFWFFFLF